MGSKTIDADLPPWLTAAQFDALRTLMQSLSDERIPYVVGGGLAGNLHGSSWPLHDIDLDVLHRDHSIVEASIGPTTIGPCSVRRVWQSVGAVALRFPSPEPMLMRAELRRQPT